MAPPDVERRREQVAELVLAGYSYRQIGPMVGVSHAMVGKDVAAIREQWQARASEAYEQHVAEAMAALDLAQGRIVEAIADGDLAQADRLVKLLDRRARLLGLDAPARSEAEVTVHDGDSDLDRSIAELLGRMGAGGETVAGVDVAGTSGAAGSGEAEGG